MIDFTEPLNSKDKVILFGNSSEEEVFDDLLTEVEPLLDTLISINKIIDRKGQFYNIFNKDIELKETVQVLNNRVIGVENHSYRRIDQDIVRIVKEILDFQNAVDYIDEEDLIAIYEKLEMASPVKAINANIEKSLLQDIDIIFITKDVSNLELAIANIEKSNPALYEEFKRENFIEEADTVKRIINVFTRDVIYSIKTRELYSFFLDQDNSNTALLLDAVDSLRIHFTMVEKILLDLREQSIK